MHYQRIRDKGEPGPAERLSVDMRGRQCNLPECDNKARADGLCMFHYDRRRHGTDLTAPKRRSHPEVKDYSPGEKHRYFKYGLTPEEFERILAKQKHRCYVCGTDTPTAKGWSVDHCHETNVVRFVACNPCNAALGLIKEDPRIAKRLYEVALECQQLRLI